MDMILYKHIQEAANASVFPILYHMPSCMRIPILSCNLYDVLQHDRVSSSFCLVGRGDLPELYKMSF